MTPSPVPPLPAVRGPRRRLRGLEASWCPCYRLYVSLLTDTRDRMTWDARVGPQAPLASSGVAYQRFAGYHWYAIGYDAAPGNPWQGYKVWRTDGTTTTEWGPFGIMEQVNSEDATPGGRVFRASPQARLATDGVSLWLVYLEVGSLRDMPYRLDYYDPCGPDLLLCDNDWHDHGPGKSTPPKWAPVRVVVRELAGGAWTQIGVIDGAFLNNSTPGGAMAQVGSGRVGALVASAHPGDPGQLWVAWSEEGFVGLWPRSATTCLHAGTCRTPTYPERALGDACTVCTCLLGPPLCPPQTFSISPCQCGGPFNCTDCRCGDTYVACIADGCCQDCCCMAPDGCQPWCEVNAVCGYSTPLAEAPVLPDGSTYTLFDDYNRIGARLVVARFTSTAETCRAQPLLDIVYKGFLNPHEPGPQPVVSQSLHLLVGGPVPMLAYSGDLQAVRIYRINADCTLTLLWTLTPADIVGGPVSGVKAVGVEGGVAGSHGPWPDPSLGGAPVYYLATTWSRSSDGRPVTNVHRLRADGTGLPEPMDGLPARAEAGGIAAPVLPETRNTWLLVQKDPYWARQFDRVCLFTWGEGGGVAPGFPRYSREAVLEGDFAYYGDWQGVSRVRICRDCIPC